MTIRKTLLIVPILMLVAAVNALAADTVLTWPASGGTPMLRFTIGKLRSINSTGGQTDYLGEALAENLGQKPIPSASFYLYLIDKSGKRVGEGYLEVRDLGAGQQAKITVTAHAMGSFVKMELQPQHLPTDEPMKIKMSITSTPSGASFKLDGQDGGVTPQIIALTPGKHTLDFAKEGYGGASTPVEIAANALPGSVNVELSPLAQDTVVLRDGTVLLGELVSVTGSNVILNVKGRPTRLDRNQVARIVLVERKSTKPAGKSTKRSAAKK